MSQFDRPEAANLPVADPAADRSLGFDREGRPYRYIDANVVYVDEDEIDLRVLWDILWRRRWLIMLIVAVACLGTILATYLMTPVYRATTTVQINKESSRVLSFQDVTPMETVTVDQDFYQTQYGLLKSRTLAKRVIDHLALAKHPLFAGSDDQSRISWFDQDGDQSALSAEQKLVDRFLEQLTIEPVKQSRLVRIHFDSADAQLSAKVTRAVAENYINLNLERRFEASSYAKNFITDRLRQVKVRLEDSEKKLVAYARELGLVHINETEPVLLQQLQETGNAVARAEQERISAEALYMEVSQQEGVLFSRMLNNPVVQQIKSNIAELEAEYQQKLKVYKTAHPVMRGLQSRMAGLQSKIDDEVNAVRKSIEYDYLATVRKQEKLESRLGELKRAALDLQDNNIQYSILKREVDTNRQLYEGLLQRLKEVGVAGGISANNISVVDQAEVPHNKYKPSLKLNLLLALVASLFVAVGIAFLVEYLDDTVKSIADAEAKGQLPVIGAIPDTRRVMQGDLSARQMALLSHHHPDSMVAEAFRSARTSLMFATSKGAPKVTLLTSCNPGEGKTTSAVNLATAYGQLGGSVLLIDADLRNPSVHRVLGMDNSRGLTHYLAGDAQPADISFYTGIGKVFAIPAGPLPPNPAELLVSDKMSKLLDEARGRFDFVILDGPPVMGLADALVLAAHADGTLLVAQSGGTRYRDMEGALKRLRSAQANLVGWMLTKHHHRRGSYGYESYYYYGSDTPSLNAPSA